MSNNLPTHKICIIDTCILDLILQIDGQGTQAEFDEVDKLFQEKILAHEKFFLPMATIFETGNHIHQMNDTVGNNKHQCALKFVKFINKAVKGEAPFTIINFTKQEEFALWIDEFPKNVFSMGLSDYSIVKDLDNQIKLNPHKKVYIWSNDKHLKSYTNK